MQDDTYSLIGRRVGNIRILDVLGYGGMSAVYVGEDEKLERQVALKVIRGSHRVQAEAREGFLREARILSTLDHPGVCQIFDYVEGESCDFLVMELIDGKSLGKALSDDLSYTDKMSISRQLLEVLCVVHERGIVHRDLKPDNVMIAPGGVVKVLDFGIARLAEARHPRSSRASRVDGGDDAPPADRVDSDTDTDVGALMGTLRYLSPEQARREPVTPASDIYSAGLLLQEMFTGRQPQEPDLPLPVLLARAADGESLPVTGLAPDLTALINRMKSVAPGARPSARDAADHLQRIIDRPRRLRRRRLMAAVGVALIVLSAGLAVQTARAVVEARRASAARAEAEDLVEFILGDLHGTLEPIGRLDLLAEITRQALEYYERRPAQGLEPEELDRHARALGKLAVVLEGQGELDTAESVHRRAVQIREGLVAEEPDEPKWQRGLASDLVDLERVLGWLGRRDEGVEVLERAHAIAEELAQSDPDNTATRLVLSACWDRIASLKLEHGDLDGCLAPFEKALEMDLAMFAEEPDVLARWNLSLSRSRLGDVYLARGDLDSALESYQAALEIARAGPDEVKWRGLAADHMAGLAGVLTARGERAAALEIYNDALDVHRQVVAIDPSNLLAKNSEVWTRLSKGTLLLGLERPREALAELDLALAETRELAAEDPSDVLYRELVADCLSETADARAEIGHRLTATRLHQEALQIRNELCRLDPQSLAWTVGLAGEQLSTGELYQRMGKGQDAAALFSTAVDLVAPVARDSSHPEYRATFARALLLVGREDEGREVAAELPPHYHQRRDLRELFESHGITPPTD